MNEAFSYKQKYGIDDLLKIVTVLRGKDGCPWDRAQDHHSLRNHLVEETYEAVEAIDRDDMAVLREELGDVLLQIVFHSSLESEKGGFSFEDVCDGICKKMIFRHPHVFGEKSLDAQEAANDRWDKMKQQEKHYSSAADYLRQVSSALPALMRTEKICGRAAKRGLTFTEEELIALIGTEFEAAQDENFAAARSERWGRILFAAGAVSTIQGFSLEEALEKANAEFIYHFSCMEKLAMERCGGIEYCNAETLRILWQDAKNKNMSEEKLSGGNNNDKSRNDCCSR